MRGTRPRRARRVAAPVALGALVALLSLGAPTAAWPLRPPGARTGSAATPPGACDPLDPSQCLLPFPNDYFTVADPSTATGRRVDFQASAMPANVAGTPIDPTAWDHNDGFSPGSAVLTFVPGLDLARTGAASSSDIGRSLDRDAPVVLLDTTTGRRVPYWAELDQTAPPGQQLLIVRPAVNFAEGHHIVVALRGLRDAAGQLIPAGATFVDYRDGRRTADPAVEARRAHLDQLFASLARAGVARRDLYLAWDFTVASSRSIAGSMLHMRDDGFASLHGHAPAFHVAAVTTSTDPGIARVVTGTFSVPSYLTGDGGPGSTLQVGADGLPERTGTYSARFECIVPRAALGSSGAVHPARPAVYGHGLLGDESEVTASDVRAHGRGARRRLLRHPVARPLLGGRPERRRHAGGPVAVPDHPRPAPAGDPGHVDARPAHDQPRRAGVEPGVPGALGRFGARAPRAVLRRQQPRRHPRRCDHRGRPGLDPGRARRAGHELQHPAAAQHRLRPVHAARRAGLPEPGRAHVDARHPADAVGPRRRRRVRRAPHPPTRYEGTPRHTVLLDEAFGDHQVANVTTEVEARTIGARVHRPALAPGRSPERPPLWGIPTITTDPFHGSALMLWDSGTPAPPVGPLPNRAGHDPHPDPRSSPLARQQKSDFLSPHGAVVNVCGHQPCRARPAAG